MPVDDQQGGGPVIAQREPGWYDDPWNAANIRRWDGEGWTGETAPKPAAAPREARPKAQRGWRVNPLAAGGFGVAVVVIALVVLVAGHSGTSPPATTAVRPLSGAPTTLAPKGLASAVLVAADVGGGWTAVESRPLTPMEYTLGPCGSGLWAHNTGGYLSSFLKGASVASAHGSLITKVVEAPSLEVANQQQAIVDAPAYGGCLEQMVVADVRSQLPAGSGQALTAATITPFSLQLPVPSRAFVVSVTVSLPGGGRRVVYDNAVAMSSGRYLATVEVSWSSDAPVGGQIVQQLAAYEASHVTALTGAS
jgi:hypothetical protein